MSGWPHGLFGRTALLLAATLTLFAVIVWQTAIYTIIVPAADLSTQLLTQRAHQAIEAHLVGHELPPDTRFETTTPVDMARRFHGFAYGAYLDRIQGGLKQSLMTEDVRIRRLVAPTELWVKQPDGWLVLSWRLASQHAPIAGVAVLAAATVLTVLGAALSARRLTAPLAALARAAARIAEGEQAAVEVRSGPAEVRSLALAFESMSRRLTELDEQRELMLGGISHDLRTPLARIRVAVELIEHEDEALRSEITASIEEMDRMIGQFLHYVRANYREVPMLASLDTAVCETLAIYGDDPRLRLNLHAAMPVLMAVQCARHTVLNLVENALDHGKSPVTVTTLLEANQAVLRVEDRGAGLNVTQWLEALRPFHRLTDEKSPGHSGLGLALVQRLVCSSGGTLTSEQIDGGFRIEARLPVAV